MVGELANSVEQDRLVAFIFSYDVRVIVLLCFLDKRANDFTLTLLEKSV